MIDDQMDLDDFETVEPKGKHYVNRERISDGFIRCPHCGDRFELIQYRKKYCRRNID